MISDAGVFTYDYDDVNRLTDLTNHKGEVFSFNYDVNNRLKEMMRPGSKTSFDFDATSFINHITHTKINTNLITFLEYSRDAVGNRTQIRGPASDVTYNYDNNNQLTGVHSNVTGSESFGYDSLGNRMTDHVGNYIYDEQYQRLKEDFKYLYVYDDNGNLASKIDKANQADFEQYIHRSDNRLIQIKKFVGGVLTQESNYTYDALNRRVEKQVIDYNDANNNVTKRFVYDGNEAHIETDESNSITAIYTHSTLRTDDMLAVDVTSHGVSKKRAQSQGSYFYLKDAQGTVTDLTDTNGNIIQHYDYFSFGKIAKVTNGLGVDISTNPQVEPYFTYTGREYDSESGYYY